MIIEMGKEYTSGGESVRILCVDAPGDYTVIGLINADLRRWTAEGANYRGSPGLDGFNLIEVKPRIKLMYWVNIYQSRVSSLFESHQIANEVSDPNRIACVQVEINAEDGEGLND